MQIGFSYIGLIFLLMLFIPNIIWLKNKPAHYSDFAKNEKRILLIFERIGEVLVTCFSLIFSDFNLHKPSFNIIFLILAVIFMVLYEIYWTRYFHSSKTMYDFYRSFLLIPVPGAVLPVTAFLALGIYGKNVLLIISSLILAVGHIGIHINHAKETGCI